MKSLSVWNYYINNKRKIVPVLIIVIASIIGLMTPPALLKSIRQDIVDGIGIFHNYISFYFNESETKNITKNELQLKLLNISGVDHIIEAQIRITQRYAISGDYDTPIYFIDENDYLTVLNQFQLELVEGTLPQKGSNEIALTTKLAKNKGLTIGSEFGNSLDPNDTIPGEYVVSGLLESNTISLGIGNVAFVNQKPSLISYYLVAPKENFENQVVTDLKKLKSEYPTISFETFESLNNRLELSFRSLDIIFNIVLAVIVTVISTSIGLLQIIFFMQRANEYGLLAAIGYSRFFIIRKSVFEVAVIVMGSWVIGLLGTHIMFTILNNYLYIPRAYLPLTLFNPALLIYSLPVPVVISIFSLVPIVWQLTRMDPVSIIERRD